MLLRRRPMDAILHNRHLSAHTLPLYKMLQPLSRVHIIFISRHDSAFSSPYIIPVSQIIQNIPQTVPSNASTEASLIYTRSCAKSTTSRSSSKNSSLSSIAVSSPLLCLFRRVVTTICWPSSTLPSIRTIFSISAIAAGCR